MALRKKTQEAIDSALSANVVKGQVGLGVDLVEIDRMRAVLERTPGFAARYFSEDERAYCDKHADRAARYAARFAAKEAVVKALGLGFSRGISVRDVEVVREEGGRPRAVLSGRAQEVAREMGVTEVPVSLSHTATDAIACAMALTADAARKQEPKLSPDEELAQQFKGARAMLDDLP